MNKTDLTKELAEKAGLSIAKAAEVLNGFIDIVTDTLKTGGAISIPGFVSITVAQRSARTGRNPQTNETITIPAKRVPKFKAGKQLKDAVV